MGARSLKGLLRYHRLAVFGKISTNHISSRDLVFESTELRGMQAENYVS